MAQNLSDFSMEKLVLPSNGGSAGRRRSNSWTLHDPTGFDDIHDEDGPPCPLASKLTNQRWHEIGNSPDQSICSTSNFDVMVEQLAAVMGMHLLELLLYWLRPKDDDGTKKEVITDVLEYLEIDPNIGNYVLTTSIKNSIRDYVAEIGKLYKDVGFHSLEHAIHVTMSMNKLLSMVSDSHHQVSKSFENDGEGHNCGSPRRVAQSYGIDDPRIKFAMFFSALIHDVGHTGVPNSVLVEEEDELAILHNDVSVAEQNSLNIAFSLLHAPQFARLKHCIGPNPTQRKFFRKRVIASVMVTDISDQERIQIVKSRWETAFPPVEDEEKNQTERRQARTAAPTPPEAPRTELRQSRLRRRATMHSSEAVAEGFLARSRRLGIRTSMDFSGNLIDAYGTNNQLQQHAVLETMMNVADVAHTMQSFNTFVKWNRRLFRELHAARSAERLPFDPSARWYENQIGFFNHYILPLAGKMKSCGVLGTTGDVFELFAAENLKRWKEEGEAISEEIIRSETSMMVGPNPLRGPVQRRGGRTTS
mmetsp:Transcript_28554/g.68072  ORF Transcript_28554/g.68072 Transcript_28554/m.68072 type:complete len:532 (+) Transcript_28554:23-1618(+)